MNSPGQGKGEAGTGLSVFNSSHPLASAQMKCVERLTGQKVERVIEARWRIAERTATVVVGRIQE